MHKMKLSLKHSPLWLVLMFLFLVGTSGCKVSYSLTGASIPVDAKTFSVDYFPNMALLVNPSLSANFTEALKNKMLNNTRLRITDDIGDLAYTGEIRDYKTTAMAITGNDRSAQTRLTITVFCKFINAKDPKQNFEKTFSQYADFDSNQSLSAVESALVEEITKKIIEDIFNSSVANW